MRDIVLINSKPLPHIHTLVVNEIRYFSAQKAIQEAHINPESPKNYIDSLIFTSKHAIKSLVLAIEQNPKMKDFLEIPSYVIGTASAKSLHKHNFNVAYIGNDSHGESFSNELAKLLKNKYPLYLRAKKIVSGLDDKLLEAKIPLKQAIVYENKTKTLPQSYKPTPRSIIIFTAPSNYFSFIQNFGWEGSYIAIAIGMTTFGVFHKEIEGYVSPEQTIESCIEFAKQINQTYP